MRPLLLLAPLVSALACTGCDAVAPAEAAPPDPEVVTADLALAVSSVVAAEPDEAPTAWREAHRLFESDLEPSLRARCGARTTTELELAFGQLRAALGTDAAPAAGERVRDKLSRALVCLTR